MENYNLAAEKFAEKHGVKLQILSHKFKKHFLDDKEPRYVFKCKLTRGEEEYTFNFGQSLYAGFKEPMLYDILSCLQRYDIGSFENFCSEFGYGEDSRKSEKIYNSVCEEYEAVERLFGDILEELREIN